MTTENQDTTELNRATEAGQLDCRVRLNKNKKNGWKLKRIVQCKKCPWIKGTNPYEIPNGYSVEKHRKLACTIAKQGSLDISNNHAMACHEMHDAHCIGWLHNQIGSGNNIGLRIRMMTCTNSRKIRLVGEQHKCFEDTLP